MRQIGMAELRTRNLEAGREWFTPGAMKHMNTKYIQGWSGPGGTYFVTSESPDLGHIPLFSVRRMDEGGRVWTVGNFQSHVYAETALVDAREMAEGE